MRQTVPLVKPAGFSATKTALRSWLRRPGPASIPQAVLSLPSMAKAIGPVIRELVVLSKKFEASGRTGGLKSAVACAHLSFILLVGFLGSMASTEKSVRAQVPLKARP